MSLKGLGVVSFESRFQERMADFIRMQGGLPVSAPALEEIPLEENQEAMDFAQRLLQGQIDLLICLTGVGIRTLMEAAKTRYEEASLITALQKIQVIARGPKPSAYLKEKQIPHLVVPEPNTWKELLQALDQKIAVADKQVAIQEYGVPNELLHQALRKRGAKLLPVPVYRWALPKDIQPLENAVRAVLSQKVKAAIFTNATQAEHLVQTAKEMGLEEKFKAAAQKLVTGSIGPISSDALRRLGLPVDLESSHPKMGILVKELSENFDRLSKQKQ